MKPNKHRKKTIVRLAKDLCRPLWEPHNLNRSTFDVVRTDCMAMAVTIRRDEPKNVSDLLPQAATMMIEAVKSNDFSEIYTPAEMGELREPLQKRKVNQILDGVELTQNSEEN